MLHTISWLIDLDTIDLKALFVLVFDLNGDIFSHSECLFFE